VVEKNARRQTKGLAREAFTLNASKLFASCCAEVKSMLGAEKTNRLPQEVADSLNNAIEAFCQSRIHEVNPQNVLSLRKYFHADNRNLRITERVQVVGENSLPLKEQLFGVNLAINAKNKRLDDLMKKATPDYDLEKSIKEHIAKLELTKMHIEASLAALQKEQTT